MKKQFLIYFILVLVLGLGLGGGEGIRPNRTATGDQDDAYVDVPIQGRLLYASGVPQSRAWPNDFTVVLSRHPVVPCFAKTPCL